MGGTGDDRDRAFAGFVHGRQNALLRFAWLVCGGRRADAEDLVQEALSRLYGRWHRVEDPERYLRTVMVRLNVSRWRKLRREVLTAQDVDRALPDHALEAAGSDAGMLRAVLSLPPRQRAAVVLRFWFDQSDEQIAEALGCTQVTVRTNVHRALARLRASAPDLRPEPSRGRDL